ETGFSLGVALSCVIRDSIERKMWPYPVPDANRPIPPEFVDTYVKVFQYSLYVMAQMALLAMICTFIAGADPAELEFKRKWFPKRLYHKRYHK
ncbi:hypothetical protein KIPB_014195, partial [Kipferlia bialata]